MSQFNFTSIIEPVKEVLKTYVESYPNLEVEGRLGIYDEDAGYFDTNIGEEYYKNIETMLNSCKTWKSQDDINCTDYFYNKLRLSVNDKGSQHCIEKIKLAQFTFVNESGPLDFRLTIAVEDPKKVNVFPNKREDLKSREKRRKQFVHGKYNFDLTRVISRENSKKKEANEYFEYEIEYINEGNVSIKEEDPGNLIFSIILKLLDASFSCDGLIKTDDNELPMENMSIHCVKEKIFKK